MEKVEIERDINKIEYLMEDVSERREAVNLLYKKLERSLAIQKLCPDAFDYGSCLAYWFTDDVMKPRLGIERGDGSTITFSFDDVPVFFKMDEAKKRGITGRDNNRTSNTPPVRQVPREDHRQEIQKHQIQSGSLELTPSDQALPLLTSARDTECRSLGTTEDTLYRAQKNASLCI